MRIGMLAAAAGLSVAFAAVGQVPSYTVDEIAPFTTTTVITGASEAGHVVGWLVDVGNVMPFVARAGEGLVVLPLPAGYNSGTAMDANSSGVIVGAVDDGGLPFDGGEPAIWVPDGSGGYTVTIPQQLGTASSPLGTLSINGGMAVAVNESGTVVGWSRYQGFQGGPSTAFSLTGPAVNLRDLGFGATVEDLNNNGVAVGGQIRFDLTTNTATDLGLPADGPHGTIVSVLGYAINDSDEVVAAGRRATSTNSLWVTYLHDGVGAWSALNPAQLATRFVGFYDNNNRGDVSATGGVLFADENVLVTGFDALLEPESAMWDTDLGYIANDRVVYTTAINTQTNGSAIVRLLPSGGGCNAADFAEPFGQLTFADISAFLAAFSGQDASADLAAPFGSWTFADISAFLGAFSAGCP